MKKILPVLLMLLFSLGIKAQYSFVVQNNGTSTYKTINDAYENAVNGDTIYLPGGSFDIPTVDKSLTWIGVGYHPDSTSATYFTRINNQANFTGNADNTYLTGLYFASNLLFGSFGNDANDVVISRCRIAGNATFKYNDGAELDINTRIRESIFDNNLYANKGGNILISNSIIRGICYNFYGSFIDRVIFTHGGRSTSSGYSYSFNGCQGCLSTNSVFNYFTYPVWNIDIYSNTNNTFKNNLFAGYITFPQGTNAGEDNITGVALTDVFENIDGVIDDYSYQHDFHLKAGSPAIGAGLSDSDIGIFDGSFTFKEGGLPFTPHIRTVNIATETTDGLLQVEVTVTAQEK